jgi:hypothetical protein
MAQKNRNDGPVARISSGLLSVSIWEQDGSNGVFYNVTAQRAFKRDEKSDWEHSDSFSRDDAPVIASLLFQAHARICQIEQKAREAQR